MRGVFESSQVKDRDVKGLIERNIHRSKGQSGRVLIVGGEERYTGAPLLAGLAALRAGADSVVVAAPEASARAMNAHTPDLVTVKLPGKELQDSHLKEIQSLATHADVLLIGPGLGQGAHRKRWLSQLLKMITCRVVIDADATKQVALDEMSKAIILANKNEHTLLQKEYGEQLQIQLGTNVLVVKGKEDTVIVKARARTLAGGHVRATVAGTGDVLAGLAASIYAQTKDAEKAAAAAVFIAKKAAVKLGDQRQFGWLASDMIDILPVVMKELRAFRVTKYVPNGKGKK